LLGVVALTLNWRVFAFASTAAVVAAFIASIYPALRTSQTQLEQALKNGGATTRRARMRHSPFVIAQVGLTLALLMGASLMVQSARELRDRDLGFNPRGLLAINTFVPRVMRDSLSGMDLQGALIQAIAAEPGVQKVATAHTAEPTGSAVVVTLAGGGSRRSYLPSYKEVSANYLSTLGIRIAEGRDLAPGDELAGVAAAVVSRTAARAFWRGEDPIGQMIRLADHGKNGPLVRVVGIAEDVAGSISDPYIEAASTIYVSARDRARLPSIVVRTSALSEGRMQTQLSNRARGALPPRISVYVDRYLSQLDAQIAILYFLASVFVALGVLALCLAMFGVFSARAQDVARRTREFAVRISLGATDVMIVRSVLRDSVIVVLAGTGLGAFFAIYAARRLDPFLYGVFYSDVRALLLGEVLLVVTTLLASLAPALRAARSNPIEILRAT
jgi:ABC-type antimicrobial peptide transport system permease subunit